MTLTVLYLVRPLTGFAQQDSLQQRKDSLDNARLDKQSARVKQFAAERLADSLKRVELEAKVAELSSTDNLKKAELQKQLEHIRQQDSVKRSRQKHEVDSLRRFIKGFPVMLMQDTLFKIYVRQGSFTAQDRAAAISARIKGLGERFNFNTDSLKLGPAELSTDIVYGNSLLISVSDQDALWLNTSREQLATRLRNVIADAVVRYQNETSWQNLVKEGLLAFLVIVVVALIIYGVNRLFRSIQVKVVRSQGTYIKGFKLKNYEVFNSDQQLTVISALLTLVKWVVVLLVLYLALPVLFGIFPFTRELSNRLLDYILDPVRRIALAVWNYVPNLITIIVLVVVFRYVIRLLRYLKTEIERGQLHIPGFYADWANPTYQIARVLVLAFMLIVIFPYLPGSDSPIFKGVSVFMGVLFTFGSAGALSNVVAGLVMTYMRAFKVGDRVKIGDVTGDVIEKTVLVTRVKTIKNELISIPNSTVMSSHTTNYSSEAPTAGLIINTTVTIGYDVPWRQVHRLLITAAGQTIHIEQDPAPFVLQTGLEDYYVSYNINAYTKEPNKQALIYSSLHANIQDCFNKEGVEIMSPHYRAVRDGNVTTVPAEYLPDDYEAPVFRLPRRDRGDQKPEPPVND
ncbi:mechanosensitive ion channel family protein [Mucilaginibacter sp. 21P]|uniref:mechanosensitive ion channel family protein n=1 Tax=Mucilaginibacter sp. 21P TaxID=2778902 RepID=UPI002107C044|nr:mechanosensitive ion channel family protein [Mucilaginibacter sp. 21P]